MGRVAKSTTLPRCGWCRGLPYCEDKGELYQCPCCERNYPKPLTEVPKKRIKKTLTGI